MGAGRVFVSTRCNEIVMLSSLGCKGCEGLVDGMGPGGIVRVRDSDGRAPPFRQGRYISVREVPGSHFLSW